MSRPAGHPRVVLSIAGSDPSGGAGIQADLKTFAALGAYGCAVITSLTAQSTLGVSAVFPIPAGFVRAGRGHGEGAPRAGERRAARERRHGR